MLFPFCYWLKANNGWHCCHIIVSVLILDIDDERWHWHWICCFCLYIGWEQWLGGVGVRNAGSVDKRASIFSAFPLSLWLIHDDDSAIYRPQWMVPQFRWIFRHLLSPMDGAPIKTIIVSSTNRNGWCSGQDNNCAIYLPQGMVLWFIIYDFTRVQKD